jgi:hypothetical protein
MSKELKEMFAEVAEKAVKEDKDIGEDSMLKRIAINVDHYQICPFRSLDEKDCPLCKLAKI